MGVPPLVFLLLLVSSQHVGLNEDNSETEEELLHQSSDPVLSTFQDPEESTESEPVDLTALHFMSQWTEQMQGFELANLFTIEIAPRSTAEFFEEISLLPATVKGAYFASSRETADIEVTIVDPVNNVKFERSGQKEGLFFFEAQYRGLYLFSFTNKQVSHIQLVEAMTVTFALRTGNITEEVLNKEHITPVEKGLLDIQTSVKDFQMDQEFAQMRQETHFKSER